MERSGGTAIAVGRGGTTEGLGSEAEGTVGAIASGEECLAVGGAGLVVFEGVVAGGTADAAWALGSGEMGAFGTGLGVAGTGITGMIGFAGDVSGGGASGWRCFHF